MHDRLCREVEISFSVVGAMLELLGGSSILLGAMLELFEFVLFVGIRLDKGEAVLELFVVDGGESMVEPIVEHSALAAGIPRLAVSQSQLPASSPSRCWCFSRISTCFGEWGSLGGPSPYCQARGVGGPVLGIAGFFGMGSADGEQRCRSGRKGWLGRTLLPGQGCR